MEELKPFIVEFNENGVIKPKTFFVNCSVGGKDHRPIIVITHDKCTFSTNDGIRRI